ncbi:IclR family transcriptional regulator [Amycolatopsis taiwanensis]|uniref:IclR family transcriptional regulator n=1 Tax=Amycolatopsis taiwanensis TaxID=342230 RepID=A0A9W6VK98_9PSEU|nr:helix-turn-helix domain-containing protein [Amycolatopsis taiwanensis]GLY70237.1 IclR family transcriptional regulator [Amycolatopsis taiwanensis]
MATPGRVEQVEGKRSVLGRAFDILECFAGDEPEQTVVGLSQQTGLPPATVHRMLAHLIRWGAVERMSRGHYRLGRRLWKLGRDVPSTRILKDVARPFLVDLHDVTGCISALCSPDGDRVAVVDVIAGRRALEHIPMPSTLPFTWSAPGIVILAHRTSADLRTPVDAQRRELLDDVRRTGVAVHSVAGPGSATWVSAPIFDRDGTIRSTLSIVAADDTVNTGASSRAVSAAAAAVTRDLANRVRGR